MKYFIPILLSSFALIASCKAKKSVKTAVKMRSFIIEIANYARETNPNFIIIPQNGTELLWNDQNSEEGFALPYSTVVSGIGQESIFYEEKAETDQTNRDLCQKASQLLPVLSSDWAPNNRNEAFALNQQYCFIPFPRIDYDYSQIPNEIPFNANTDDISNLKQIKNYLYLIGEKFSSKEELIAQLKHTNQL